MPALRPPSEAKGKKEPVSKRNLFIRTIIAAILGLVVGDQLTTWLWKRGQRADFGSVNDPTFQITATLPDLAALTSIQEQYNPLDRIVRSQSVQLREFQAYESKLLVPIREISQGLKYVQGAGGAERMHHLRRLDDLCSGTKREASRLEVFRPLTPPRTPHTFTGIQVEEGVTTAFDPELVAKSIFKKLTEKDFPEDITFTHDKQEGVNGSHHPVDKTISSTGLADIDTLYTLLHESGHVVAQHQEENAPSRLGLLLGSESTDAAWLEEACAFAFLDAGIRVLYRSDKETALAIKIAFEKEVTHLASHHHAGDSSDPHSTGAAIYLAVRRITKDPAETFNALCTVTGSQISNLPSNLKAQLDASTKTWKDAHTFSGIFEGRKAAIRAKLREVERTHQAIRRELGS